ncbi:MAG TPA: pyruvate:ferredoxin (flavodoxin) oxidoreductase [Opitutaceae bacterium]
MKAPDVSKASAITLDANEAVASVAYRTNEIFAIYPITPSSPMAEYCDEWAAQGKTNLWGDVPQVVEMQSEGGAAGLLHGSLQGGAFASTFTASQGLLLMIPNFYKIAGELTPCAVHVTARTLATHALSIFGDHFDVMACRQTGWAMVASNSVQEAQDLAAIVHAATLRCRVPFIHFFDNFRTSHEVNKIIPVADEVLRQLMDEKSLQAFRERRLTPDKPVIRGTAQNPDAFFQAREAINGYYATTPGVVEEVMEEFEKLTGRRYSLFDYEGHPEAERVAVIMGSGAETVADTVRWMCERGERVGVIKVRLYRPFSVRDFASLIPASTKTLAVLDRTKEPGAPGEPLFLDVVSAIDEAAGEGWLKPASRPRVIGGRYGLSSKEFTPAMAMSVLAEAGKPKPRRTFTVGINDDVTHLSLDYDAGIDIEPDSVRRAVFFGLGSDGTVGANKNTIKIIGEETDLNAQGYFVYDSKKSGAITISHLRFGPKPIRSPYLIGQADFVACHQFNFLESYDVLSYAAPGAVFLVNAPGSADSLWGRLPREVQAAIRKKGLKLFAIDAYDVARRSGMGGRINTVMQVCFFELSGVLPPKEAIDCIKKYIEKTYGRKGAEVVRKNFEAVDNTLASLFEVAMPDGADEGLPLPPIVSFEAPDFVQRITATMLRGHGDLLPVSAFPVDGTWPTATACWEKRNVAAEIPVWDPAICIQCNKCVMICPHAAIRAKFFTPDALAGAPETYKSTAFKSRDNPGTLYTLQVAPEDCTGCTLCVAVCPAKNKSDPRRKAINMEPQAPLRASERKNYRFFLDIPDPDRTQIKAEVKASQFLRPLFEYSGACNGCGETPYLKLLTQLFGDRTVITNATGCSSIYGGNLPTTPYTVDANGRGPAWSNSLFEDNAEFGAGIRYALDHLMLRARSLVKQLAPQLGDELVRDLLVAGHLDEAGIKARRGQVAELRARIAGLKSPAAAELDRIADHLVPKSMWIVGGDGWAYDIGFGGLDHVFTLDRNVNILVLDTEVYSNTGGQRSKSTPLGATAKFSAGGKETPKKDLGLIAMSYGGVYVARVAMGAKDTQTLNAFREAESYDGPSLILAYSHCIAHGFNLALGAEQQKLAVDSGHWPLYRFDPRKRQRGENPLSLDSAAPKTSLARYRQNELRFRTLEKVDPVKARAFAGRAEHIARARYDMYQQMAAMSVVKPEGTSDAAAPDESVANGAEAASSD